MDEDFTLMDALYNHFMVDTLADDFTNYLTKSYIGYPYLIEDFLGKTDTFDDEFIRTQGYSPISYDMGTLICDIFFARCNAAVTMREGPGRTEFLAWSLDTIVDIVDMFATRYDEVYENYFTKMNVIPDFKAKFLKYTINSAAACFAIECRGRLLSMDDKARSVRDIENPAKKDAVYEEILTVAAIFAKNPGRFICGADFAAAIEDHI